MDCTVLDTPLADLDRYVEADPSFSIFSVGSIKLASGTRIIRVELWRTRAL